MKVNVPTAFLVICGFVVPTVAFAAACFIPKTQTQAIATGSYTCTTQTNGTYTTSTCTASNPPPSVSAPFCGNPQAEGKAGNTCDTTPTWFSLPNCYVVDQGDGNSYCNTAPVGGYYPQLAPKSCP